MVTGKTVTGWTGFQAFWSGIAAFQPPSGQSVTSRHPLKNAVNQGKHITQATQSSEKTPVESAPSWHPPSPSPRPAESRRRPKKGRATPVTAKGSSSIKTTPWKLLGNVGWGSPLSRPRFEASSRLRRRCASAAEGPVFGVQRRDDGWSARGSTEVCGVGPRNRVEKVMHVPPCRARCQIHVRSD